MFLYIHVFPQLCWLFILLIELFLVWMELFGELCILFLNGLHSLYSRPWVDIPCLDRPLVLRHQWMKVKLRCPLSRCDGSILLVANGLKACVCPGAGGTNSLNLGSIVVSNSELVLGVKVRLRVDGGLRLEDETAPSAPATLRADPRCLPSPDSSSLFRHTDFSLAGRRTAGIRGSRKKLAVRESEGASSGLPQMPVLEPGVALRRSASSEFNRVVSFLDESGLTIVTSSSSSSMLTLPSRPWPLTRLTVPWPGWLWCLGVTVAARLSSLMEQARLTLSPEAKSASLSVAEWRTYRLSWDSGLIIIIVRESWPNKAFILCNILKDMLSTHIY